MSTPKVSHPKGLPYLFFSEMWERFGYYLMIGIFTLYLKDATTGFGMVEHEAADLYGTFIALVFLTPFLGGLLADRYLGYRLSITLGGLMMGAGYCLMAVPGLAALYASMFLVIIGNGFFKPNISTLLGNLYNDEPYKAKKDEGYNIFYMGINIGAFICNFFGAALQIALGWSYAFLAAGVGMFIGVLIFWIGSKHYAHADVKKPAKEGDMPMLKIVSLILLPAVLAGYLGWIIPGTVFGSDSTDAFILGCIPVIYFYAQLLFKAPKEEKKPIAAMLAIFAVVIVFWAVFKQNGTALTTWADRYTNREVPQAIVPVIDNLKLSQVVTNSMDSVPQMDNQFRVTKQNGKIVKVWGHHPYLINLPATEWPRDGEQKHVFATNLYQSVNPAWVIILTPLVVAFFSFLRRHKREPSTPAKIAWGLFISGLSTLLMVGAVYISDNGAIKASSWWLILSYGVITVGELFLSPMGLSLVSKLSPPRLTALMMGGWFLSTSIGNKLSGVLAALWDTYDDKSDYFLVNFGLLMLAALGIFLMLRWLNSIFKAYS